MKAVINGKETEMSVLQAATGFRATALSLDHNDLKVLTRMSDERLDAMCINLPRGSNDTPHA